MPVGNHAVQSRNHGPSEQSVHQPATGKFIIDSVRQPRLAPHRLEFMAVNPPCERPFDLFIHKKQAFPELPGYWTHILEYDQPNV